MVTAAAFSVAAAWAAVSATRHDQAKAKCIADFFNVDDPTASGGDTICNIFPWVDVGIMGGLWALLAAVHVSFCPLYQPMDHDPSTQIYLFFVLSSYGKNQRRDHAQYEKVPGPSQPLTTENIPLQTSDPWDSRPSEDFANHRSAASRQDSRYTHLRNQSSTSASDIMSLPSQEPKDGFRDANYEYDSYKPSAQVEQYPTYPNYAHTQGVAPTPTDNYYRDNVNTTSHVERPMQAQPHPGES